MLLFPLVACQRILFEGGVVDCMLVGGILVDGILVDGTGAEYRGHSDGRSGVC